MSGNAYDFLPGLWTNNVNGIWTLTLDQYWGSILASSLVIYLGFLGFPLWCLVKFAAHQSMIRQKDRSDLTTKTLLCLRNKSSPFGFAWSMTKLLWQRKRRAKAWAVLPLIVLALCVAAALITARIFVVYIQTHGGGEVRLRPNACGAIFWDKNDPWQQEQFRLQQLNSTLLAQTRVDQCSHGLNPDPTVCGIYPDLTLRWQGRDTDCFLANDSLCILNNSRPYLMDSGLLHLSTDLGDNAARQDSVYYNRKTVCSPIHNTAYEKIVNMSDTRFAAEFPLNDTMQLFFYGPFDEGRDSYFNETYAYSTLAPAYQPGYDLQAFSNEAGYLWSPTPTFFNREDATITLMFLTDGHVGYDGPVKDPWFSASTSYIVPVNEFENKTYYAPDFFVNSMACMDQHRIRDANKVCTPLASSDQLSGAASLHLSLNARQKIAVDRISLAISESAMVNYVAGRGGSTLLASRMLQGSTQVQLHVDQWQKEMGYGFGVMLNVLQQKMIDQVAGPRDAALNGLVVGFATESNVICKSQLIRIAGSGFSAVNFNFAALLAVAIGVPVLGALFYFTDKIVFKIEKGKKGTGSRAEYARLEWRDHDMPWLWRNAMAARGVPFEDDEDAEFPEALGDIPQRGQPYVQRRDADNQVKPDIGHDAPHENVQTPLIHVELDETPLPSPRVLPGEVIGLTPGEAMKMQSLVSQASIRGDGSSREPSSSRAPSSSSST